MRLSNYESPMPLGFSLRGTKSHFTLFSEHASQVFLAVFHVGDLVPWAEYPMQQQGPLWHVALDNLPPHTLYAFRCEGPSTGGHLFNSALYMADPYAKVLEISQKWADRERSYFSYASPIPPFDWQGVKRPLLKKEDLIIYEMHVRGFTQHPSSDVQHHGTFLGMVEKIPYLKELGINAVELLPIFEFDEIHCKDIQPHTGEPLPNYWGYNTLFFMAPMRRYAAHPSIFSPLEECKTVIRELHRAGIEVILDVVFNHTGEGNEKNYFVHFRGIDNTVYYMIDSQGEYRNYTGCGNTLNSNHPIVQQFILDTLLYWIEEFQIDGFRFDLASILNRGLDGEPLTSAPIVEKITDLCLKKNVKLIAEAWDAAGLYQVGFFPSQFPSWSDWNGRYRDAVRKFIKGTSSQVGAFADALSGSSSVYHASKTPLSSINFITAHDGYSLRDLVTYQMKHNFENGEMNRDGANENDSWNCGAEGPTINGEIATLREKQLRNFFLALFLSQGIPMLLMGDEYGHSRKGNNNPFVQDNEINWFLWNLKEKNQKIVSFVSSLIAFRKKLPSLRKTHFLTPTDIEWHGTTPHHPDWGEESRHIAFTLQGEPHLYVAFNAHNHSLQMDLPKNNQWRLLLHTQEEWEIHHLQSWEKAPFLGETIELPPYTSILAIS